MDYIYHVHNSMWRIVYRIRIKVFQCLLWLCYNSNSNPNLSRYGDTDRYVYLLNLYKYRTLLQFEEIWEKWLKLICPDSYMFNPLFFAYYILFNRFNHSSGNSYCSQSRRWTCSKNYKLYFKASIRTFVLIRPALHCLLNDNKIKWVKWNE